MCSIGNVVGHIPNFELKDENYLRINANTLERYKWTHTRHTQ